MRLISLVLVLLLSVYLAEAARPRSGRASGQSPNEIQCFEQFRFSGSRKISFSEIDINVEKCGLVQYFVKDGSGKCQAIDLIVSNRFDKQHVGYGDYGCHLVQTKEFGYFYCMCGTDSCNTYGEILQAFGDNLKSYAIYENATHAPESEVKKSPAQDTIPAEVKKCAADMKNGALPKIKKDSVDAPYVRNFYECVNRTTTVSLTKSFKDILKDCEVEALEIKYPTTTTTTTTPEPTTTTTTPDPTTTANTTVGMVSPVGVITNVATAATSAPIINQQTSSTAPAAAGQKSHKQESGDASGSKSDGAGYTAFYIIIAVLVVVIVLTLILMLYLNNAKKNQNNNNNAAPQAGAKSRRNVETPVETPVTGPTVVPPIEKSSGAYSFLVPQPAEVTPKSQKVVDSSKNSKKSNKFAPQPGSNGSGYRVLSATRKSIKSDASGSKKFNY